MKLIIAEKPSVAQAMAKKLYVTVQKSGYFISNDYIILFDISYLKKLQKQFYFSELLIVSDRNGSFVLTPKLFSAEQIRSVNYETITKLLEASAEEENEFKKINYSDFISEIPPQNLTSEEKNKLRKGFILGNMGSSKRFYVRN